MKTIDLTQSNLTIAAANDLTLTADQMKRLQDKWDELVAAAFLFAGAPVRQKQTAIRLRGGRIETVELREDGTVVEPVRCRCQGFMHRSDCPFFCAT